MTLFRITGVVGGDYLTWDDEKFPVLMQHGSEMSPNDWFNLQNLPLKLFDRGYDVWLSSARGTKYSNVNKRDGEWSLKERWDFSWAEMGYYDMPAFTDKILELTKKPKVTLVGFS